jgi:uncharacterized protein (TIGR02145 family)
MKIYLILALFLSLSIGQDYSLSFNGEDSDRIILPDLSFSGNELSVLAKFKTFGVGSSTHQVIIREVTSTNLILQLSHSLYDYEFGITTDQGNYEELESLIDDININNWTNIAATYNGDTMKIFIDNEVQGSISKSGIFQNGGDYYIGNAISNHGFNGLLDEISIWDTALSDALINEVYDQDIDSTQSNLIAYYKFNAGQGSILYDYSGNGNHGTIYGATWVCNNMDLCGECGGDNTSCEIISDVDGNEYGTIQIGHQVWMRQNLKTIHYNNGDEIPTGLNNNSWMNTLEGAYAVYADDSENVEIYGNLYNWYAVDDDRGVCPEGWDVPSDEEFTKLTDYLGGSSVAGGKLKSFGTTVSSNGDGLWKEPNLGATNESGFSGLGGGTKGGGSGNYGGNLNHQGHYWTTTSDIINNDALPLVLSYLESSINRAADDKNNGFSIRCLSDETQSTTLHVPENFATIQEAIDYSIDGDTVRVAEGVYHENIRIQDGNSVTNKSIYVIGDNKENTIIDGTGDTQNPGLFFRHNEESHFEFSEFTIQNFNKYT